MTFLSDLAEGVSLVFSSLGVVRRAGLSWAYAVVALCVLLLMAGSVMVGGLVSDWVSGLVESLLTGWLASALGVLVRIVVWLLSVFIIGLVGGCLILVLLSPVLARIALRTWQLAVGDGEPRPVIVSLAHSVGRGVVVALRCLVQQFALLAVCFVLSFVPVAGFVAPVLSLGIYAYFYGIAFSDYAFELAGFTARRDFSFASANRGLMVGVGLPFAALLLIPFVGQYLALLFAPASAAAGVKLCLKRREASMI